MLSIKPPDGAWPAAVEDRPSTTRRLEWCDGLIWNAEIQLRLDPASHITHCWCSHREWIKQNGTSPKQDLGCSQHHFLISNVTIFKKIETEECLSVSLFTVLLMIRILLDISIWLTTIFHSLLTTLTDSQAGARAATRGVLFQDPLPCNFLDRTHDKLFDNL